MRIPYPHDPGNYWIDLPDRWIGLHAQRFDQAQAESARKQAGETLTLFNCALALLSDWNLPGLNGNPEAWDFTLIDLPLIMWVIRQTLPGYYACFAAPMPALLDLPAKDPEAIHE